MKYNILISNIMGICKTKIKPSNNVSFDISRELEHHKEYTKNKCKTFNEKINSIEQDISLIYKILNHHNNKIDNGDLKINRIKPKMNHYDICT